MLINLRFVSPFPYALIELFSLSLSLSLSNHWLLFDIPGVAALDVHVDKVPTCLLPTTSSILAPGDSWSLLEGTGCTVLVAVLGSKSGSMHSVWSGLRSSHRLVC
ncbi:unnamed protein product, partial [Dicrocoelium dendriticum]